MIEELKMQQITGQFQSCFWKFEEALKAIERGFMMGEGLGPSGPLGGGLSDLSNPAVNHELRVQVEFQQK